MGRTVPSKKRTHATPIAAEYLAELKRRVMDGPGIEAVARAAGIHRQSVWRAISGEKGRAPTVEAIEKVRAALAKLEPASEPMPPPVVAVRGVDHYAVIQLADAMTSTELAGVLRSVRKRK